TADGDLVGDRNQLVGRRIGTFAAGEGVTDHGHLDRRLGDRGGLLRAARTAGVAEANSSPLSATRVSARLRTPADGGDGVPGCRSSRQDRAQRRGPDRDGDFMTVTLVASST